MENNNTLHLQLEEYLLNGPKLSLKGFQT